MYEWTRVQIAELLAGQWPGEWGSDPDVGSESAVVYRSTELDDDGHVRQSTVHRSIIASKLSVKKLAPGDILLEASGGTPGRAVGRVGLYAPEKPELAICSNFLRTLRPKVDVCSPYLRWVLMRLHQQPEVWRFQQQTTGMSNLHVKGYLRHKVDMAPLPQQRRIAEILATVDEAIDQTAALMTKTQSIKAGLMQDLFTRGVMPDGQLRPPREDAPKLYTKSPLGWIPKEWVVECLGDLTPSSSQICYGIVQPGDYHYDGVPIVAIYNLNADYDSAHRSSQLVERAYARSRIHEGDVLLSIKGSIGRVDVTPPGFTGNISRDVARIRPRAGIQSLWLRYALESKPMQTLLDRISVGTTRLELSIGRLKKVQIALPQEQEQNRIAQRIAAADGHLDTRNADLLKLESVKQGLMEDLLSGRVRVPIDERKRVMA